MELVVVMSGLVAVCALALCAVTVVSMAEQSKAHVAVLSDILERNSRQAASDLSRAHGSLGMALTEAAARTAEAIGSAVAAAVHAPVPEPRSVRDEAYVAARDLVGAGEYRTVEPDDDDVDPTDRFYATEREDLAVVRAGERNPTGVPGFAFDLPYMPDDMPIPNGAI